MITVSQYSHHNTTTVGEWQEIVFEGVTDTAAVSPVEVVNRSETEMLWYSWNYPDGTHASATDLSPMDDGTYCVFPRSKMVIAPNHIVNQFLVTSINTPIDFSIQVIW